METSKQQTGVNNKLFAAYVCILAAYMGYQIYQGLRPPPKIELPFDPNREIRQEYERKRMEREMAEWDAEV